MLSDQNLTSEDWKSGLNAQLRVPELVESTLASYAKKRSSLECHFVIPSDVKPVALETGHTVLVFNYKTKSHEPTSRTCLALPLLLRVSTTFGFMITQPQPGSPIPALTLERSWRFSRHRCIQTSVRYT